MSFLVSRLISCPVPEISISIVRRLPGERHAPTSGGRDTSIAGICAARRLSISVVGSYQRFLRPILFKMDPENAHHLAIATLGTISRYPSILRVLHGPGSSGPEKEVFGLHFPNPIGL